MEDALTRLEYPAMLERLGPAAAVAKFNERVRKIGRINAEIADWLSERRKVEEAYVVGLRKLSRRQLQDVGSDLGILEVPWKKITNSTETIASAHATLSQRIEKDVEQPLRNFSSTNKEMSGIATIQGNLANMAKELEDAQDKSDKLSKKGGKASTQKVDTAASNLSTATQLWESQSPFIFENLQALDEGRLDHIRNVLTLYETHEADAIEQSRVSVEQTLRNLLEIDTQKEIQHWSQNAVAGAPSKERRTRQLSSVGSIGAAGPGAGQLPIPETPRSSHGENASELSARQEGKSESKFSRSRLGTILNRRRQSVHGGFARAPSPTKNPMPPFPRNTSSRDGRPSPSPRASSNNLREETSRSNRLSSLSESPTATRSAALNGNANYTSIAGDGIAEDNVAPTHATTRNGSNTSAQPDTAIYQPPPDPYPYQSRGGTESQIDSAGFTIPNAMNDPISQAQQEAAQEASQSQFKLDIQQNPIVEQDAEAQAALSSVADTLRSSQLPNRKVGTVRGRREVRNTVFMPHANSLASVTSDPTLPTSPSITANRAATLATLSSFDAGASMSDSNSVRSGYSLANNVSIKHAEMHQSGLNASIVEIMHASTENGVAKTLKVNGEVSLVYNGPHDDESQTTETEIMRINNFASLEAIGENRAFIHRVAEDKPDEFTVALAPISHKPTVAFNYRVHIDETDLESQNPVLIKPTWKPGEDRFDFVIEYSLNPAYGSEAVTFQNFGIIFRYTDGRPTACQMKPLGTFKPQQSCVFWRFPELVLTTEVRKIVCRLKVAEGALPSPGVVDAKWEMAGSMAGLGLSRLENAKRLENDATDPFADDTGSTGKWIEVETSRKLVSGKYEAAGILKTD